MGIECVLDIVRRGRLRWFGHVERKDDTDWVKACQKIEIAGKRGRGRGKKTWSQCIDEDLRALQLNVRDAQNWLVWRRGIDPFDPC